MRIAVLTVNRVPFPGANGSCVHLWALVQAALHRQHKVALCCYKYAEQPGSYAWSAHEHGVAQLRDLGVEVCLIPPHAPPKSRWRAKGKRMGRLLGPGMRGKAKAYYDDFAYRWEIEAFVEEWRPDVLYTYGTNAAAAASVLPSDLFHVATLVDLDHLPVLHKRAHRKKEYLWMQRLRKCIRRFLVRTHPAVIIDVLRQADMVIEHAAHHCRWVQAQGISQARYYPVLVLDQAGVEWESACREAQSGRRVPRILLVGKVTGAATLPGLQLLADEILPEVERQMGGSAFEVHIVGGGELAPSLQHSLKRPFVKQRGYVEDIAHEFRASDLLLVPTPVELGFRTRISEGFSYGCCVVAHEANMQGMPELRHDVNCLIGGNGREIADQVVRALKDRELRDRIALEARATYERLLDGLKVGGQIIKDIEQALDGRGKKQDGAARNSEATGVRVWR